jgi:hypothetical protein
MLREGDEPPWSLEPLTSGVHQPRTPSRVATASNSRSTGAFTMTSRQ